MFSDVNVPARAPAPTDVRLPRAARWVVLGALLCAFAGGVAGWLSTTPRYRATGVVRLVWVDPDDPAVELASPDEIRGGCVLYKYGPPPTFDSYLDSQLDSTVAMMSAPRLLHTVATGAELGALGVGKEALEAGLSIQRVKRTRQIAVSFEARDPVVATGVVDAVIEANRREHDARTRGSEDALGDALQTEVEKTLRAAEAAPDDEALIVRLTQLRTRIAQLQAERLPAEPRLRATAPVVPVSPATDRRPLFAGVGAIAGALLVLLTGWVVGGARSSATNEGGLS